MNEARATRPKRPYMHQLASELIIASVVCGCATQTAQRPVEPAAPAQPAPQPVEPIATATPQDPGAWPEKNDGTIKSGRHGVIGNNGGTCCDRLDDTATSNVSAPPPRATVTLGEPVVTGDLDVALVRIYVKRNIQKIAACYGTQQQAKRIEGGTVVAHFFISDLSGNVLRSDAIGVDPDVSKCVADAIQGFGFPKPKTRGGVEVTCPLTFAPHR